MSDAMFDMSPEEKKQISMEFIAEAVGHLEILNEKLLKVEAALKSGEAVSADDLNAMFRAAHTIKGTASFIGLRYIVSLTHDMETLLQQVKNSVIPLNTGVVDVLFSAMDALEGLCVNLKEKGSDEGDVTECIKNVKQIIEQYCAPSGKPSEKKEGALQGGKPEKKFEAGPKINKKYLDMFIFDTDQNIASFEKYLLAFEENPERDDLLNGLFRVAHTLKGSAGLVSAVAILRLSHSMENVLSCFYNKSVRPTPDVIALLLEALDELKNLNAALKRDGDLSSEIPVVCEKLDQYCQKVKKVSAVPAALVVKKAVLEEKTADRKESLQKAILDGCDIFKIIIRLEEGLTFKSIKAVLLEERLKKNGILISMVPSLEMIPDDLLAALDMEITFCAPINEKEIKSLLATDRAQVLSIERVAKEDFKEMIACPAGFPGGAVSAASGDSMAEREKSGLSQGALPPVGGSRGIEISIIKIDSHKLDALMNLSGELVTTRARFAQLAHNLKDELLRQKDLVRGLDKALFLYDALEKEVAPVKTKKFFDEIREELLRLNSKIFKDESMTGIARAFGELTSTLGKISSGIQNGVMQTRMVPIEGVFTRFKRVVRDLSKELNKEADLVVEGEETELDKKIIDSLGDPLTHMIRNAIDHGLEDKKERLNSGKPLVGTLRLKAFHQGSNICVEVSDDGRGMDTQRIAQTAFEKGLVTKEELEAMTDEEKLNLIFIPGFSMAQKVTDFSGRGVGMDVVKNMINAVSGSIEIQTVLGQGTTFVLKMPLTLAIIQALLVIVGQEIYAFPLESVTGIVNINKRDIYSVDGNDTIKLRNHVLSLVELEHTIGLGKLDSHGASSKIVVVVTDGHKKVGVVVDSLAGKEEIVIKSLSEHFSGVRGVAGASILGDGRIAFILDAAEIIQEA